MPIAPLALAAVPAGIAAIKLTQQVAANQPFRQLLSSIAGGDEAPVSESASAGDDLTQLHALVQERLASAGIATSIRFEISADADGHLVVGGNHPRRAEIEQALQGDTQITAALQRIAANYNFVDAAQRDQLFAEQYIAGADAVPASSDNGQRSCTVIINGDEIEIA